MNKEDLYIYLNEKDIFELDSIKKEIQNERKIQLNTCKTNNDTIIDLCFEDYKDLQPSGTCKLGYDNFNFEVINTETNDDEVKFWFNKNKKIALPISAIDNNNKIQLNTCKTNNDTIIDLCFEDYKDLQPSGTCNVSKLGYDNFHFEVINTETNDDEV